MRYRISLVVGTFGTPARGMVIAPLAEHMSKNVYEWKFSLGQAPDLEQLKALLHGEGTSSLIQTGSGVCIRSERSAGELQELLVGLDLKAPVALQAIEPGESAEEFPPDIVAFAGESADESEG